MTTKTKGDLCQWCKARRKADTVIRELTVSVESTVAEGARDYCKEAMHANLGIIWAAGLLLRSMNYCTCKRKK